MTLAPPRPAGLDPDALAAAVHDVVRAGSVTFVVGGAVLTYRAEGGQVHESDSRDGDTVVALSPRAWSDLVTQVRTPIGLLLAGELAFERGDFSGFAAWDRTLRYLHNGVPPYSPARADLAGRDPRQALTLYAPD
jgi:hypothetical protein